MLKSIAPDLWTADHAMRMPGGWFMPLRMAVVRLPDGGLWLHSVVPMDDALAAAIDALGPVRHLVAPNRFHHLHLVAAHQRWPSARTWGAPGLGDKRPEVTFDETLGDGVPAAWGGVLTAVHIHGAPKVAETVFVHGPSGSLLVTDLMFCFERSPSWKVSLVLHLMGVLGGLRQSRAWRFAFCKDRAAAAASVARLRALPITRVVPCHGSVLETDVAPALDRALKWMSGGQRVLPGT